MPQYFSVHHTLGYDRFPAKGGYGTIPAEEARHDNITDQIGAKLRCLWHAQQGAYGWSSKCERQRRDTERMCALNGYTPLWTDPRDYIVHIIGQSLLYDVPAGKRGHLAQFVGKCIRVVCTRSGVFQRFVWIGAVGRAQPVQRVSCTKPTACVSTRPRNDEFEAN